MSDFSDFSEFFPALRKGLIRHLVDRAVVGDGPDRRVRIEHTLMAGTGLVVAARCVIEVLRPSVTALAAGPGPGAALAATVAALAMLDERSLRVLTVATTGEAFGAIDGSDRVAVLLPGGGEVPVLDAIMDDVAARRAVPVQVVAVIDETDVAIRRRLAVGGLVYIGLVTPDELGVSV